LVGGIGEYDGSWRMAYVRGPEGISHHGQEFNPEAMGADVAAAAQAGVTLVPRVRAEVERFFDGWELIEPGVVPLVTWRPVGGPPADPNAAYLWAGVARKP
jgi:hypothetical protein